MGRDKARIVLDGVPLLLRVLETARAVAGAGVVVVAADGQSLPPLPEGVGIARDLAPFEGPLAGFARGLVALPAAAALCALVATDLPWLEPSVLARVARLLRADADAAIPRVHGRAQPLAAVYRRSVSTQVERLLAAGERSMRSLEATLATQWLEAEDLLADAAVAAADPDLDGFRDVDTEGDLAERSRSGR